MKHKLLFAAAAAALLAPTMAPGTAFAQDSGVYLKGQIGYGVTEDATFGSDDSVRGGATFTGDVAGGGDVAYGVGLGYDFGENWRIEGEYNSLFTDFGTIAGQPSSFAKLRTNAYMANLLYDFSDFGRFQPFVGAGIGLIESNLSASAHDFAIGTNLVDNPACITTNTNFSFGASSCEIDDSENDLGWQLLAGLGYNITDNLSWDTHYRYVNVGDVRTEGDYTEFAIDPDTRPTEVSQLIGDLEDVSQHMIMTGFRYRFGASAPKVEPYVAPAPLPMVLCPDGFTEVTDATLCPPVVVEVPEFTCWDGSTVSDLALCPQEPVMVQCPDGVTMVSDLAACPIETRSGQTVQELCGQQNRQEIIYYEFNKGQSAETRNTINRILDIGQFCQVNTIRVVGHTDTSGSAAYNLNLSKRRAADAREELVRQGINPAVISSEGKGETEPFVPTGDGVKEQLNRRTEVLINLSSVGASTFN